MNDIRVHCSMELLLVGRFLWCFAFIESAHNIEELIFRDQNTGNGIRKIQNVDNVNNISSF